MFDIYGRKTPLIVAAEYNLHDVMDELLKHKASVSHTDRWGNTPLHYAADKGYLRCVTLLLLNHSPLDVVNRRRLTPLMRAAMKGHEETARQLLDSHATLSSQLNENKESALTLGCRSVRRSYRVYELNRLSPTLKSYSGKLFFLRKRSSLLHMSPY